MDNIKLYIHLNKKTMKKLILLFSLLVILTACSTSDNEENSKDNFNPPDWIIGSWRSDNGTMYTFRNDDIICTSEGNRVSYKDKVAFLKSGKSTYSITETKTNDSYIAEFKVSNKTTIFSFSKISDTKITSNEHLSGNYKKH